MIELTVDQTKLIKLAKLMKAEADSVKLKADLVTFIHEAAEPGVSAVQGKLRAMPNNGVESSPALGSYLAARVKPSVRMSGKSAGVSIRIPFTPQLRGFKLAARRLNKVSWRHKVYGNEVWVRQESPIPGFFDETLSRYKEAYAAAVWKACQRQAMRLGERL